MPSFAVTAPVEANLSDTPPGAASAGALAKGFAAVFQGSAFQMFCQAVHPGDAEVALQDATPRSWAEPSRTSSSADISTAFVAACLPLLATTGARQTPPASSNESNEDADRVQERPSRG